VHCPGGKVAGGWREHGGSIVIGQLGADGEELASGALGLGDDRRYDVAECCPGFEHELAEPGRA
jgi:hypothetical protein